MDRHSGEEDGYKIKKLIKELSFPRKWESSLSNVFQKFWIPVFTGMTTTFLMFSGLVAVYFMVSPTYAAEELQQQEENKVEIEVEKQSIVVKIERPSLIFPLRWKDPDIPEEREYILKKDFSEEIKKIINMSNE